VQQVQAAQKEGRMSKKEEGRKKWLALPSIRYLLCMVLEKIHLSYIV
jgi:hypothetical protein